MFCFSDQLNQMKMWTVHFSIKNSQQYFFFKQTLLVNSRGSIFSLPTYLASKDLYSLEKLSCSTILSSSVAINDWISFRKMDLLGCFNLDFNYSKSNKDHNFRFRFTRSKKTKEYVRRHQVTIKVVINLIRSTFSKHLWSTVTNHSNGWIIAKT